MATAEELKAQIAAARQRLHQEEARTAQLLIEVQQAAERQRLREELELVEERIAHSKKTNVYHEKFKSDMDTDSEHRYDHVSAPTGELLQFALLRSGESETGISTKSVTNKVQPKGESVDCNQGVVKGEYEWRIKGMSWLVHALKQDNIEKLCSDDFHIGDGIFDLVYHPFGGVLNDHADQIGSLAIRHTPASAEAGITFRYRLLIKEADGSFTQWGATGDECDVEPHEWGKAFGPDVQTVAPGNQSEHANGILSLSHKQLLASRWVQNDVLTVKAQMEVRADRELVSSAQEIKPHVQVPPVSLHDNMSSLLGHGRHSDVTFIIQGERVTAHAAILCARSEVFDRELMCGMSESVSKEVVLEDCDAATFKAFLKFLYTDDLAIIDDAIKSMATVVAPSETGSSESAIVAPSRISLIQGVMAISHKYEVLRLQLWCQQQLCQCISAEEVCSIFCQAHLHEAKQLEQACLQFIKLNMAAVVTTPAFGSLAEDWPEVVLKINICMAGISEAAAAEAFAAQQQSRKTRQKRESSADGETGGSKRKRDD